MTLLHPNFAEEKKLWRKDFVVVGVDEVGRGSWAGPVVASAVAFGVGASRSPALSEIIKLGINDSKALSSPKRGQLAEIIKECSIWSVAEVGVGVINSV